MSLFSVVLAIAALSLLGNVWLFCQYKKSQTLALIDELTQLPNRRAFELAFNRAQAKAARGQQYFVALFDLDKFKQINDTFGHAMGDEALKAFVAKMRGSDFLARTGGDEFCLIGEGDITQFLSRMHCLQKQDIVLLSGDYVTSFSFSLGVCEIEPNKEMKQILSIADENMYKNKQKRKNNE